MRKLPKPFARHIENPEKWKWNIVVGVPSLGQVHIKWALAYAGLVMPMNFSMSRILHPVGTVNPLRYHVAEAQNAIIAEAMQSEINWEWVLLIEDDVVVPPNILIRMSKWVKDGRYPIISGLYHLKSEPPEPMTFRGKGNGAFEGWKKGPSAIEKRAKLPPGIKPDEVCFCDGVPTGCLLISMELLKVAWNDSPVQVLQRKKSDGTNQQFQTREIFKTVREAGIDPESGGYYMRAGTSDLEFCDKAMKRGWLKKAGFDVPARMTYPYPVDLNIECGHIDLATGRIFA